MKVEAKNVQRSSTSIKLQLLTKVNTTTIANTYLIPFSLAIHRISPIIEDLKKDVQVVAFDLPKDVVRYMVGYNFWQDDDYKKLLEHINVNQQDTLSKVRQAVQKLINAKHRCVWLYSHKDDFALLCCLPQ